MVIHTRKGRASLAAAATGAALLAACATPAPPPPPPPPPPPVVEVTPEPIPYRPIPPGGAPYVMEIPGKDANGVRMTVNANLDPVEALWNFRSGWNVAALNCNGPEDGRIIDGYSAFLRTFSRPLAAANTELDRRIRRLHTTQAAAVRAREARMTSVYNYFAQPPARADFCAVARVLSAYMLDAAPTDANALATAYLPQFEGAFERFFADYETYQVQSAAWDQQYGAQYGASQPGYVAVWGNGQAPALGIATSLIAQEDGVLGLPAGEVLDPLTGVAVPIIPAPDTGVTTPVVQPLPAGPTPRRR